MSRPVNVKGRPLRSRVHARPQPASSTATARSSGKAESMTSSIQATSSQPEANVRRSITWVIRSSSRTVQDLSRLATFAVVASSPGRLLRRWALRFSVANRHRKAARIVRWLDEQRCQTVLLIGVGDEAGPSNKNIVEQAVAEGRTVVASLNIQRQTSRYPLLRADARNIPMRSGSVDFALSNAIIEHVG